MKKIFTLVTLLLITGCSCNYELSIQNNNVYETLKINGVTTEIPVDADLVNLSSSKYKKEIKDNIVTYTNNYSLDGYKRSTLLTCYDSYSVQSSDDRYVIRTGKKFKCYPYQYNDFDELIFDNLEIKIKTNHKVINHNADKVEENTYYWHINEDNIDNADIYFEIEKQVNNPIILGIAVFLIAVLIVGVVVYFIVKSKSEKNNKI